MGQILQLGATITKEKGQMREKREENRLWEPIPWFTSDLLDDENLPIGFPGSMNFS